MNDLQSITKCVEQAAPGPLWLVLQDDKQQYYIVPLLEFDNHSKFIVNCE